MQRPAAYLIIIVIIILGFSCSEGKKDWTEIIPEDAVLFYRSDSNISLSGISELSEIALLDDITPGNVQNVQLIENRALSSTQPAQMQLQALYLYPANASDLETVWISSAPADYAEYLSLLFSKSFKESRYDYLEHPIFILYLDDITTIFVLQLGEHLFISESSLALEKVLRTSGGMHPSLKGIRNTEAGELLINTPQVYRWLQHKNGGDII
jgi:hypothetical protein